MLLLNFHFCVRQFELYFCYFGKIQFVQSLSHPRLPVFLLSNNSDNSFFCTLGRERRRDISMYLYIDTDAYFCFVLQKRE